MSQHAKDECPCCDDCWAHDYDRCGSDDCSCHGGPASERCGPCNGEGIINLSDRDFAQIAPLLAQGKTKYPDGEEIQTMARCGVCQGTGIKP